MRRRTAIAVCCAVFVGVCGAQSRARAQRTSSLSWVRLKGTEECISTQALAERVEQRVGHAVFVSASQADLSLEGHVERVARPSAFVATLIVSDRSGRVLGRRVLRAAGERCDELTAPLVLVIAIAVDARAALPAGAPAELSDDTKAMLAQLGLPELTEERIREELAVPDAAQPEPAAIPDSAPPPPVPPPAAPAPVQSAPSPRAAPGNVELSARLSGGLGVLPDPSLGIALGPTLDVSSALAVDLWVSALLPQTATLGVTSSSARFELLAAGAGACARFGAGRPLELRGCAGMSAGVLYSQGRGFDRDGAASGPWLEPTLYAAPVVRKGGWLITARLGAGVPLVRDEFRYQASDGQFHGVHRASPVVARLELGGGIAF
jgi:hypothetical protein